MSHIKDSKYIIFLQKFSIWFVSFFMVAFAGFAIKLLLALLFWCDLDFIHRSGEIATVCIGLSILTLIEYKSVKIKNRRLFTNLVGIALGASLIFRVVAVLIELNIINDIGINVYINLLVGVIITALLSSILSIIVLNKAGKIK